MIDIDNYSSISYGTPMKENDISIKFYIYGVGIFAYSERLKQFAKQYDNQWTKFSKQKIIELLKQQEQIEKIKWENVKNSIQNSYKLLEELKEKGE